MVLTYYILHIAFFIFGLIVGSFLNCLIYRLEQNKGKSILKGKSFCPRCQHALEWFDLVPLLSFFLLKGRCRHCHKPISWQYPAVELATAFTFLLLSFKGKIDLVSLFLLIIWALLIVIFVYDLKHYIIPDKILWFFFALVVIYRGLEYFFNNVLLKRDLRISASGLHWHWLFALAVACFFFLIWLFSKGRAMGFGDVKLIFPLMLLLGWPFGLVGLFISFLSGSVIGIALIIAGKKKLKSQVPFGPFLITGSFVAFLWGNTLWQWYLHLIFIS